MNVRRLQFGVFAVSGALAGLVGPFLGPVTEATYTLPGSLALIAFVGLAIGGYGSVVGSALAAVFLGLAYAFIDRYLGAQYQFLIIFGILLVVLLSLPNGLFGARRERMV